RCLCPLSASGLSLHAALPICGSGAPTQAGAAPGGQGGLDSVLGDLLGGMFGGGAAQPGQTGGAGGSGGPFNTPAGSQRPQQQQRDRKSTRLNSSHVSISYAVF